ncbi:MAG TPA: MATE family efflux transporter [bacterium]|nr:MATE family efflux transporter [bacterium]
MSLFSFKIFNKIILLAYPLILSSASFTIMQFFDRLFLSWYSKETIAAAIPAGILSFSITSLFIGIVNYSNALVAQYYGAKQFSNCAKTLWQSIYFSLIVYPIILLFIPIGFFILNHSGHNLNIIYYEKRYFGILIIGSIFILIASSFHSFFTGLVKTLLVLIINIIGNLINIIFNYLLIFGKFGFPKLDIFGAGLSTILSEFSICLFLFLIFISKYFRKTFYSLKEKNFDKEIFVKLLKFGIPSGLQFFLDIASFAVFVFLIGIKGTLEQVIGNITLSLNMFMFMPMVGLSIACSTLVGHNLGAKKIKSAERIVFHTLCLALFYLFFISIIYLTFSDEIILLFKTKENINDTEFQHILHYVKILIYMMILFNLFDSVGIIISGALKGAGDTKFQMWISIIFSWFFFVPLIFLISVVLKLNIIFAFLGYTLYLFLLSLIFIWRFINGFWKTIKLI